MRSLCLHYDTGVCWVVKSESDGLAVGLIDSRHVLSLKLALEMLQHAQADSHVYPHDIRIDLLQYIFG